MITGGVRRQRPSAALATSLVLAVAVMHILMLGCLTVGGSMAVGAMAHDAAAPSVDHHRAPLGLSAAAPVTEHISAAMTDCIMGDHGCVFVRADVIVVIIGLGLVLAIAPLRAALGVRLPRRTVVLGRPPPWAVLDHLQLSVIRR